MLPLELCRLCSLTPGQDKLCFSVFWELTTNFQVIGHRFARTIINSCAQFSYDQVQCVIEGRKGVLPKIYGNHSKETIKGSINFLNVFARSLSSKRFENGSLKIDQKKIIFSLNEDGFPDNFRPEIREASNKLIEELMLLANITVANKLSSCFSEVAFLRSHSPPISNILEKLQKNLEKYGVILNIKSAGSLNTSLERYSGDDMESIARMLVLNSLLAKPMAVSETFL